MSGISLITALEILGNPHDLEIEIFKEQRKEKFGFGIFRGSGHYYKPLVTSSFFADKKEEVAFAVGELLKSIYQVGLDFERDPRDGFTLELIERILEELKTNSRVSTEELSKVKP